MENTELTKNVTGWLHGLLSTPGVLSIDASDSEKMSDCKKWLADINTDRLLVSPNEDVPDTPKEPLGGKAEVDTPPE